MAQTLSDSQLVARCRSGDQQAWAELVDRFSRYVYAIAVQAFRLPESDAEDVFQEVFARAYQHLDKLRDDAAVRPWLAQLTRRLCIDRLRAASRERRFEISDKIRAQLGVVLGPRNQRVESSTVSRKLLRGRDPTLGRRRQCRNQPGQTLYVVPSHSRITRPQDAPWDRFLP